MNAEHRNQLEQLMALLERDQLADYAMYLRRLMNDQDRAQAAFRMVAMPIHNLYCSPGFHDEKCKLIRQALDEDERLRLFGEGASGP